MAVRRQEPAKVSRTRSAPASTPEARELQLASLAYDLAERQMEDGTASAQVITHFLKAKSSREMLEQERMRGEIELNKAKQENLATLSKMEDLVSDAIQAFRGYSGQIQPQDDQQYLE